MLDFDDDHARVIGAGPFLVKAMGVVLDDPVVAGQMEPFAVIGLEFFSAAARGNRRTSGENDRGR